MRGIIGIVVGYHQTGFRISAAGEEKVDLAVQLLIEAAQETSSTCIDRDVGEWQKEDLDACLQRLTTKLHGIMIQHNRLRNHNLPLYQLPLEILAQVLSLALQDALHTPIYMKRLQVFASVSHRWLRLVKETPSFWMVISSDLTLPLFRQVLSRSMGRSLDVVYSKKPDSNIPKDMFTTLVVEHAH
ncbi:hypothetical protein FRB94_002264 [Tulasnella sp. JGI-2019a]|nr:hypothetical protein FRB94_002264 [Tulasnella sp. JGI-2019a]